MSSKRTDKNLLGDIVDAVEQCQQYVQGYSFEQFVDDRKTQDAIVRNLEIMGEAAKHVSGALTKRHPEIPWRTLAGVRDRVAHDYFGINYEIIWGILTQELATLKADLRRIIES